MEKNELKSFSAVATHEVKKEAHVMVASIRKLYDQPIFLYCDDVTREYLGEFPNMEFKPVATPETLAMIDAAIAVKRHNEFHRPDCISMKMDVMQWAIRETGNTMFVDADVYIVKEIHADIINDIMLSPNYYAGPDKTHLRKTHGVFNAGYVFASTQTFTDVWRRIYQHESTFYEQQGMLKLYEYFDDIGNFSRDHNVGFWRCGQTQKAHVRGGGRGPLTLVDSGINWKNVKSIHGHLYPECYSHAPAPMNQIYAAWAKMIKGKI